MKKVLLIVFALIFVVFRSGAQDRSESVEKSIWGMELGLPPLAVYNESRIADKFSLRSEFSLGFAWQSGNETQWAVIPVIQIEPRYYHNIKRRAEKGKRIDGNSGNFLSLVVGGDPGVGIKSKNIDLYPGIFLIPMYGFRRNIGLHFNYEFAFGVGYAWTFQKYTGIFSGETYNVTTGEVVPGIRIAIGYVF
jgi:hypothetical protein